MTADKQPVTCSSWKKTRNHHLASTSSSPSASFFCTREAKNERLKPHLLLFDDRMTFYDLTYIATFTNGGTSRTLLLPNCYFQLFYWHPKNASEGGGIVLRWLSRSIPSWPKFDSWLSHKLFRGKICWDSMAASALLRQWAVPRFNSVIRTHLVLVWQTGTSKKNAAERFKSPYHGWTLRCPYLWLICNGRVLKHQKTKASNQILTVKPAF